MNASLASIHAGLRPVLQHTLTDGTEYFRFASGQVRRQIGQGHSRAERAVRRELRASRRARVKERTLFVP